MVTDGTETESRTFNWTVLRGSTPDALIGIWGTLDPDDDVLPFLPDSATQITAPMQVTLYDPAPGLHDVTVDISGNNVAMDQSEFQLYDGQAATLNLTPFAAADTPDTVVVKVDGVVVANALLAVPSLTFTKDVTNADTPAGMPNRIPPRVTTPWQVTVGGQLAPGQLLTVRAAGDSNDNGNFSFNDNGRLWAEISLNNGVNNFQLQGTSQTLPPNPNSNAGKLSIEFVLMDGMKDSVVIARTNGFSVAAIPIAMRMSDVQNVAGRQVNDINTKFFWWAAAYYWTVQSDSAPIDSKVGIEDLSAVSIGEQLQIVRGDILGPTGFWKNVAPAVPSDFRWDWALPSESMVCIPGRTYGHGIRSKAGRPCCFLWVCDSERSAKKRGRLRHECHQVP
jgi:hypothetical protein